VNTAGVLDAANSKNVGSVTRAGTNIDCFSGIPFAVRGGQAVVDEQDSGFEVVQFGIGNAGGTCPAGTQAFSYTFIPPSTAAAAGVYVVFYG
jgi:hypothetical protein